MREVLRVIASGNATGEWFHIHCSDHDREHNAEAIKAAVAKALDEGLDVVDYSDAGRAQTPSALDVLRNDEASAEDTPGEVKYRNRLCP